MPLPDWPRAGGLPGATARLRIAPEDFLVSEELGFEPAGEGGHDWLLIRKRNRNSADVARDLARHAGVQPRSVGYSGLKDRRAVTCQWFSVERPAARDIDWAGLCSEGVTVLRSTRHRRKLRRGTHRWNHFSLVLCELSDPRDALAGNLERLQREGAPNYFGEQRFGRGGGNIRLAQQLFEGRRLSRAKRSLALSAARSLIFNDLLAMRIGHGSWNRLLPGDVANLEGSRSVFAVDAPDAELTARAAALDLHPTGPLWGRGAPAASGEPGRLEAETAAQYADLARGLEAATVEARRALRMPVADLAWQLEGDRLRLDFRLPRGCYATAVVRELVVVPPAQPRFSRT